MVGECESCCDDFCNNDHRVLVLINKLSVCVFTLFGPLWLKLVTLVLSTSSLEIVPQLAQVGVPFDVVGGIVDILSSLYLPVFLVLNGFLFLLPILYWNEYGTLHAQASAVLSDTVTPVLLSGAFSVAGWCFSFAAAILVAIPVHHFVSFLFRSVWSILSVVWSTLYTVALKILPVTLLHRLAVRLFAALHAYLSTHLPKGLWSSVNDYSGQFR